MIYIEYAINFAGKKFIFNGCNEDIITRYHISHENFYELEEPTFISSLLRKVSASKHFQIVDAGANTGNHSIYLSYNFPECTIHAFEVNPITYALLQKSVTQNNINNIRVYNIGLYESACRCGIHMPKGNKLGGARIDMNGSKKESELYALDDIVLCAGTEDNPVKFIKIDVEGSEVPVIKGAQKTIEKNRPIIFCEIHEPEHFVQIKDMLSPLSYHFISFQKFLSPNFLLMPDDLIASGFSYTDLLDILHVNAEKTMAAWDRHRKLKQ